MIVLLHVLSTPFYFSVAIWQTVLFLLMGRCCAIREFPSHEKKPSQMLRGFLGLFKPLKPVVFCQNSPFIILSENFIMIWLAYFPSLHCRISQTDCNCVQMFRWHERIKMTKIKEGFWIQSLQPFMSSGQIWTSWLWSMHRPQVEVSGFSQQWVSVLGVLQLAKF